MAFKRRWIPREIFNRILSFIPAIPTQNVFKAADPEPWNSDKHHVVWTTIFRSDEWMKIMDEQKATPLLFMSHLHRVRSRFWKTRKRIYLSLDCEDETRNPDHHMELFRKCLHPHKHDARKHEIIFSWGIVLNISEIENPEDRISLNDKR